MNSALMEPFCVGLDTLKNFTAILSKKMKFSFSALTGSKQTAKSMIM